MENNIKNEIITSSSDNVVANRKDKFKFAHNEERIHDTKFETKQVSYLRDCLRRFVKNKSSVVGFFLILIIVLFGIFEPIVDNKNHVNYSDFPNGFQDVHYSYVLPKLEVFEGTGFWDGTKDSRLNESNYNLAYFTDANRPRVQLKYTQVESKFDYTVAGNIEETYYYVKEDTYAVGCDLISITPQEYNELVEYEKKNNIYQVEGKSIIKPLVNSGDIIDEPDKKYSGYLGELEKEFREQYGYTQSMISSNLDKLYNRYQQNPTYFFALRPIRTGNSRNPWNWNAFEVVLNEDGTPVDIYSRDSENNLNYYRDNHNGSYTIRVDYESYFEYRYGFTPSYVFGSNSSGQDLFLRLALGVRFSLLLGLGITIINLIIGLIWGSVSGYYGGRVDLIMERITDIISNIPSIIILTIANIQLNNNVAMKEKLGTAGTIIIAFLIAFVYNGWVGVASTTRMQFYRFKGQEYVLASRTLGARDRRLIFKHILPNAIGTLVTSSVLMIPSIIFSESTLSYLGIINFDGSGIASIGALLNEGKANFSTYPHVLLFPALIISLLMISFNLFGNGLRDAFNTSLRGSED